MRSNDRVSRNFLGVGVGYLRTYKKINVYEIYDTRQPKSKEIKSRLQVGSHNLGITW